jgi:hypothetical protein
MNKVTATLTCLLSILFPVVLYLFLVAVYTWFVITLLLSAWDTHQAQELQVRGPFRPQTS